MAIRNKCPGCSGDYQFEKIETGQHRTCPHCQAAITLTKPESRRPIIESVIVVVVLMIFVGKWAWERNLSQSKFPPASWRTQKIAGISIEFPREIYRDVNLATNISSKVFGELAEKEFFSSDDALIPYVVACRYVAKPEVVVSLDVMAESHMKAIAKRVSAEPNPKFETAVKTVSGLPARHSQFKTNKPKPELGGGEFSVDLVTVQSGQTLWMVQIFSSGSFIKESQRITSSITIASP